MVAFYHVKRLPMFHLSSFLVPLINLLRQASMNKTKMRLQLISISRTLKGSSLKMTTTVITIRLQTMSIIKIKKKVPCKKISAWLVQQRKSKVRIQAPQQEAGRIGLR
jgi:uncharacterized membrane protein